MEGATVGSQIHYRTRARARGDRVIVANLKPYIDACGDITEEALIRGCPVVPAGARLIIELGAAKMDTRRILQRAFADPHLGWHRASKVMFTGYNPRFVDHAAR